MTCAVETKGLIKIFRNRWTGKEVRAVDGMYILRNDVPSGEWEMTLFERVSNAQSAR